MDFDLPTDLIHKAQIGFREAAGLSSFDRRDKTIPSISTVEASISSLDPSPSYLRCKICQGKLLRGLQSLICIYCGENQKKDLHPEPISFNSTHGYSWLLQSLNFNGSERIGSLAEESEINGGQSPAEDELTLSELLDLKISWQHEPEKLDNNINIKTSEDNSSLNLGTTDFNHFFTKSTTKSSIVPDILEEQTVAIKSDQYKIIEDQENLTSDWSAEFQTADIQKENEKPESVDLFEGAEADMSARMDVGFGQKGNLDFKKPNDDSDPFQVDLFANMGSATLQQNEQLDSVVLAKDGLSDDVNNFSLKNVDGDWFTDGNWQTGGVKNTVNDGSLQDNPNDSSTDLFENANWQKGSTNNTAGIKDDNYTSKDRSLQDNPNDSSTDWFANASWQKSSTNNTATNEDDNNHTSNDWSLQDYPNDSSTDWFENADLQKSSTNNIATIKDDNYALNDGSLKDNRNDSSTDWFENADWQKSSTNNTATIKDDNCTLNDKSLKDNPNDSSTDRFENADSQKSITNNATTIKDDNLFDIDNSDKHYSDVTDWFQNSQWAIGGSSSATDNVVSKDDGGFGEWNDFTSSTGNQDSVQASWKETGNEKMDFGNFLQSDVFSGNKNPNDCDIFSEASTTIRNANTEAGKNARGSKNDEITPDTTASVKDDVQMLMSQMHDLSFMLKNELSVPSKPNDTDS